MCCSPKQDRVQFLALVCKGEEAGRAVPLRRHVGFSGGFGLIRPKLCHTKLVIQIRALLYLQDVSLFCDHLVQHRIYKEAEE